MRRECHTRRFLRNWRKSLVASHYFLGEFGVERQTTIFRGTAATRIQPLGRRRRRREDGAPSSRHHRENHAPHGPASRPAYSRSRLRIGLGDTLVVALGERWPAGIWAGGRGRHFG